VSKNYDSHLTTKKYDKPARLITIKEAISPLKFHHKPIQGTQRNIMATWEQAQNMTRMDQDALSLMALQFEDRESFGFSRSPTPPPPAMLSQMEHYRMGYAGPKDKKKKEARRATDTINSSWRSARRSLLPQLKECLEPPVMPNSPVPKQPKLTATKKSLESVSPLKLEPSPSREIPKSTGNPSGSQLNRETWNPFPPLYEWSLIVPSGQSDQTIQWRYQLIEMLMSFGVVRVLENHDVLGTKQEMVVMLSAHDPSSGTVIKIRDMLLLMNFVEVLTQINLRHRCRTSLAMV